MPLPLAAVPFIAQGAKGIFDFFKGNSQVKDAERRSKYNIRPTFNIEDEYFNNQDIATSMAQSGLSDEAKSQYTTNAERGLGSSIGAILATGGGVNGLQGLYDKYDRNMAAVSVQDAELKNQNLRYLMKTNNDLAEQKTQKWAIDKYEPYKDEAKAISATRANGEANINTGINSVIGAGASYAKSQIAAENGDSGDGTMARDGYQQLSVYGQPATGINPFRVNPSLKSFTVPGSYEETQTPEYQQSQQASIIQSILGKYQNSPYARQLHEAINVR